MLKTPENKRLLLGVAACASFYISGVATGAIIGDIPLVKFKPEVSLDTLLTFVGLVGAIIIVPLVINRYYSKRDSKNSMILADIEGSLEVLKSIAEFYKGLHVDKKKIKEKDMKQLTSSFRDATNYLKLIADVCDRHPGLEDFRSNIYDYYNENTYKDHTESTRIGTVIDEQNYLRASRSMSTTILRIRKTRYKILN